VKNAWDRRQVALTTMGEMRTRIRSFFEESKEDGSRGLGSEPKAKSKPPLRPNYSTTHQWARELKRRGVRTLICVQFRIPNNEYVLVGKYNGEKLEMTASEAAAAVLNHTDPMGLEVIIPRRIMPKEITRTNLAPQITGWRYYPSAKGKEPFCHCKFCNRGEIRAKRLIREDA